MYPLRYKCSPNLSIRKKSCGIRVPNPNFLVLCHCFTIISFLQPKGNTDQKDKDRHFYQWPHHSSKSLPRIKSENGYGNRNGQFKVIPCRRKGYSCIFLIGSAHCFCEEKTDEEH